MSEAERQKSDYEAITWAWKIVKEHGNPEQTDFYWDSLKMLVSEMRHEGELYDELGQAIFRAMETRMRRTNKCKN